MKYMLMILAVSLTACTATLKTPRSELSWTSDKSKNVLNDDRPAPVITQKDLEKLDPYLLAAPLLLAVAWMTFAYMRERKS